MEPRQHRMYILNNVKPCRVTVSNLGTTMDKKCPHLIITISQCVSKNRSAHRVTIVQCSQASTDQCFQRKVHVKVSYSEKQITSFYSPESGNKWYGCRYTVSDLASNINHELSNRLIFLSCGGHSDSRIPAYFTTLTFFRSKHIAGHVEYHEIPGNQVDPSEVAQMES